MGYNRSRRFIVIIGALLVAGTAILGTSACSKYEDVKDADKVIIVESSVDEVSVPSSSSSEEDDSSSIDEATSVSSEISSEESSKGDTPDGVNLVKWKDWFTYNVTDKQGNKISTSARVEDIVTESEDKVTVESTVYGWNNYGMNIDGTAKENLPEVGKLPSGEEYAIAVIDFTCTEDFSGLQGYPFPEKIGIDIDGYNGGYCVPVIHGGTAQRVIPKNTQSTSKILFSKPKNVSKYAIVFTCKDGGSGEEKIYRVEVGN